MSDQYEGKEGEWLYDGERNINTVTGDQKSGALGLSVNENMSFYALEGVWRSCSSVEGHSSGSSHMKLGGSPQLRRTTREPVGLDMPGYKCLCEVLCSDFPSGVEAFLSHLQKAEVWPNGSYSPSRPTWGGLRARALLLALPPVCQTGLGQLVCAWMSIRATGTWHVHTRAHACTQSQEWRYTTSCKNCCNILFSSVDAGPGSNLSIIATLTFYCFFL